MNVVRHRTIMASPANIWRCLTEHELRKIWQLNIVTEVDEAPDLDGIGSRTKMQLHQNGRILAYEVEVVEWQHNLRLALRLRGPTGHQTLEWDVIYDITSGDTLSETILSCDMTVPIKGIIRLFSPLIRIGLKRSLDSNLDRIALLAETLEQ